MWELFDYQKEGVDWLASKTHAYLADMMGLGKSAQAIIAADQIGAKNILVICPANLRINWEREFEKFSYKGRGFKIINSRKENLEPGDNAIISYDLAAFFNAQFPLLRPSPWDLIIVDEAHFLKSRTAERTKAVIGKKGFAHNSKRTWFLSGTPCPNHAGEIWPILYACGVTALSYQDFIDKYCDQIPSAFNQFAKQIVGTKKARIPELKKLIEPFMLRRPFLHNIPVMFEDVAVEAGKIPPEEYEAVKEQLEIAGNYLDENQDLETLAMLLPSVSSLRRFWGLQKILPVGSIIKDELESQKYEKIVIFCIHRSVVEGLAEILHEYGVVKLYGGMSNEAKQKAVDSFQNTRDRTSPRVFIGNIQSAGVGITLTASHHVAIVEQDWVPGNNAQAIMRCRRIGQNRPVEVKTFYIPGSLDEKIERILARKTKELTMLLDDANSEKHTTEKVNEEKP